MTWAKEYGHRLAEEAQARLQISKEAWVVDRVARVLARLQRDIPVENRFSVLVFVGSESRAFTVPGNYIYISRRLFEICPSDDAVAFIVAHEMAHHSLGHFVIRWSKLGRLGLLHRAFQTLLHGHEYELAADARAIEMCMDAGYEASKCLHVFALLRRIILDYGDVDGAIANPGNDSYRTHPPLEERKMAVRHFLKNRTPSHVFRTMPIQSHCHCKVIAEYPCSHCAAPLCAEDFNRRLPCKVCDAPAVGLCDSCNRSDCCLTCGTSINCHFCTEPSLVGCDSCDRLFCLRHTPGESPTCQNCVFERGRQEIMREKVQQPIGVLLIVIIAVTLLYALRLAG